MLQTDLGSAAGWFGVHAVDGFLLPGGLAIAVDDFADAGGLKAGQRASGPMEHGR